MFFLDFEEKLKTLQEAIQKMEFATDTETIKKLNQDLKKEAKKVFSSLTPYQKLLLARHQDRPHAIDYINLIMDQKYEIHGDRHYGDDKAIVAYMGYIGDKKAIVIGEEKGRGTKNKTFRNFGMPSPEGYRKALRIAKMAERFNIPLLLLVDTPGAYPGIKAEETGQSEAIATNLLEFTSIKVPVVSVVIGEGGSGGALAISVSDKLAMMQYSVYSVISPEGCASILWNDQAKVEQATKVLKISADDLLEAKLIDDIIKEPLLGAHREKDVAANNIKEYFLNSLEEIEKNKLFLEVRYEKLTKKGSFTEDLK